MCLIEPPVFKILACRTILVWLLLLANGAVPVLENPGSTLISMHERFVWLRENLLRLGCPVPGFTVILKNILDVDPNALGISFLEPKMILLRYTNRASGCGPLDILA